MQGQHCWTEVSSSSLRRKLQAPSADQRQPHHQRQERHKRQREAERPEAHRNWAGNLGGDARLPKPVGPIVAEVNQALRGWKAYFRVGNSSRKFAEVDDYVRERLAWRHDE
jgi:hypothetical protein